MSGPKNLLEGTGMGAEAPHNHKPQVGQIEFKGIANVADREGMIAEPRAIFASYSEDNNGRVKKQMIDYSRDVLHMQAGVERAEHHQTFEHNIEQYQLASKALNKEIAENKRNGVPHSNAPVIMHASEFKEEAAPAVSAHKSTFTRAATQSKIDGSLLDGIGIEAMTKSEALSNHGVKGDPIGDIKKEYKNEKEKEPIHTSVSMGAHFDNATKTAQAALQVAEAAKAADREGAEMTGDTAAFPTKLSLNLTR